MDNIETSTNSDNDGQAILSETNYFVAAVTEYIFTLLPFIVYVLVFYTQGRLASLFRIPEWSFATTILIGQTILALLAYPYGHGGEFKYRRVIQSQFLVATALVFLLVPTLLVLAMILLAGTATSTSTYVLQFILFVVATISFFIVAWVSPDNRRYRAYILSVGIKGKIVSLLRGTVHGE